jgi:Ca-activated chloride channel family protein
MREAAKSSLLDSFVLEYQTYMNTPDIRYYEFTPFGFRHDNPIYAIGELSAEKRKILTEFVEFTQQERYQILA